MGMDKLHILRSWGPPDPFAPACGCEIADCGFVIAGEGCDEHNPFKTIRNMHHVNNCPATSSGEGE